MKLLTIISSFIFLFANTCNSPEGQDDLLELTGIVEETGITSYQYGSHTLNTEDTFYALKSEKVDLDQFVGKKVKVSGSKIEGYPVDGGPDYILVEKVSEQ
ncbi:MAG TPA: hypothetical protein VLO29_08175 [Salegentibacter sp.]|nr:hypothetical protein [Salegentibacter sp.]